MPLSHELRCIFVHIPKTGGTSIEAALGMFHDWKQENLTALFGRIQSPELVRRDYLSRFLQHLTISQIRELLAPECLRYFSFAMVRNPWDRMVSSYANIDYDMLLQAKSQGIDLEKFTFMEFVEMTASFKHIHFLPQHQFILDEHGRPQVDFIGRFEKLADDFQHICSRLCVSTVLPKRNASQHGHYRSYYDMTTREMVRQRYQEDVELFGYEF